MKPIFQSIAARIASMPATVSTYDVNLRIESANTSFRVFVSPAILVSRSPERARV